MKAPDDPGEKRSEREPKSSAAEDSTFMEEILIELSAQNEHARSERARRSTPPRIDPSVKGASHPPIIHVKRDDSFRTAEGMPRARAYLPVRTLPPNRAAPVETATVHVADPRRMPTIRVARPGGEPTSEPEGAPSKTSASEAGPSSHPPKSRRSSTKPRASSPPLDDLAPTLRSAAGLKPDEPHPSHLHFWIGGVAVVAVVGALAVTLAVRAWSASAGTSAPSSAPPHLAPSASGAAR